MSIAGSLPRKWSMRKICHSSSTLRSCCVQRPRRCQVVAEGLFHHDPRVRGEVGVREAFDDHAEQRRRDLEVEDWRVLALDRARHLLIGFRVAEVARHHRQALREPREYLLIDRFACGLDRTARMVVQRRLGPIVEGDSDDRAVQQLAALEPVQRSERHLPGQVAGDAEDHQYVRGRGRRGRSRWLLLLGVAAEFAAHRRQDLVGELAELRATRTARTATW